MSEARQFLNACPEADEVSDETSLPQRGGRVRWHFSIVKCLVAGLLVATIAWCTSYRKQTLSGDIQQSQMLSEEKSAQCSKPGENCAESKQCCTKGMQCYEKNAEWAVCNFTCSQEIHSFDTDGKPWSCKKLGKRTPSDKPIVIGYGQFGEWLYLKKSCAKTAEDCSKTKKCCDPGMQCYEKNDGWASCNGTCTPEVHPFDTDKKPWSCKELGERTPLLKCGWPGTQCVDLKCCRIPGQSCYYKKYGWAACKKTCKSPWNCTVIGKYQAPPPITPAFKGQEAGTSLYCFSVVSKHIYKGIAYERNLINMHKTRGLGIFACDASDVYDAPVLKGGVTLWGSFSNTNIFLEIWQEVQKKGAYKMHDWTIKMDPDAVLLPDRLRQKLVKLRPPSKTALYLKNTWFKFGFMGSCEVFSKEAVSTFVKHSKECAKNLGVDGGEDFWTMQCLNALGVPHMTEKTLLNDKYSQGDAACQKTLSCNIDWSTVDPCGDKEAAAFHPYKSEQIWLDCYKKATEHKNATEQPI